MLNKSCYEFIEDLGSAKPVPGGGGASALAAAMGMALGSMVGNLTVGKKKYEEVEEEIRELLEKSTELCGRFMELAVKDAEVFAPLSEAYSLPSDTEEQKAYKEEVLEKLLAGAASVPFELAVCCIDALNLLEVFGKKGSRMVISDAGTGAALCRGALMGARMNVLANLKLMKNQDRKAQIAADLDHVVKEGLQLADRIYQHAAEQLSL